MCEQGYVPKESFKLTKSKWAKIGIYFWKGYIDMSSLNEIKLFISRMHSNSEYETWFLVFRAELNEILRNYQLPYL